MDVTLVLSSLAPKPDGPEAESKFLRLQDCLQHLRNGIGRGEPDEFFGAGGE
jgi:hypothetical protein